MTPRDVYQCQTDCPVFTTSANKRNMTNNRIRQKSEPGHRILKVSGLQPVVRFLFSKSGPPPTSNLSARSATGCVCHVNVSLPYPPLDNIRVMVIVEKLRGNIIRTAQCWIVSHNVHNTRMSSSYRSCSRLGLSHCHITPCIEALPRVVLL